MIAAAAPTIIQTSTMSKMSRTETAGCAAHWRTGVLHCFLHTSHGCLLDQDCYRLLEASCVSGLQRLLVLAHAWFRVQVFNQATLTWLTYLHISGIIKSK